MTSNYSWSFLQSPTPLLPYSILRAKGLGKGWMEKELWKIVVGKQTIHHHLSKPSVPCRQQKARHRMSVVKKTPYLISLSCQLYHHQKSQSKTSDNHVKVFWRYFEAFDFPPTNLFDICPHLLSLKRNHARKVVIFGSYASLPKANLLHLFFPLPPIKLHWWYANTLQTKARLLWT